MCKVLDNYLLHVTQLLSLSLSHALSLKHKHKIVSPGHIKMISEEGMPTQKNPFVKVTPFLLSSSLSSFTLSLRYNALSPSTLPLYASQRPPHLGPPKPPKPAR